MEEAALDAFAVGVSVAIGEASEVAAAVVEASSLSLSLSLSLPHSPIPKPLTKPLTTRTQLTHPPQWQRSYAADKALLPKEPFDMLEQHKSTLEEIEALTTQVDSLEAEKGTLVVQVERLQTRIQELSSMQSALGKASRTMFWKSTLPLSATWLGPLELPSKGFHRIGCTFPASP